MLMNINMFDASMSFIAVIEGLYYFLTSDILFGFGLGVA
jgi:hypothetical protein